MCLSLWSPNQGQGHSSIKGNKENVKILFKAFNTHIEIISLLKRETEKLLVAMKTTNLKLLRLLNLNV